MRDPSGNGPLRRSSAGARGDERAAYVLIILMASAVGVRNAVVRPIAVPGLTTTVLTMTLTGFAAESRFAGGSGRGSVRRLAAVLAMLVGAVAGELPACALARAERLPGYRSWQSMSMKALSPGHAHGW